MLDKCSLGCLMSGTCVSPHGRKPPVCEIDGQVEKANGGFCVEKV